MSVGPSMVRNLPERLILLLSLVLSLALAAFSSNAIAATYKCVDDKGHVEFQSVPCPERQGTELSVGNDVRIEGYPVYGLTLPQLQSSMHANSPNSPFFGRSDGRITWNFRFYDTGGECRMTSVGVDVRVVISMPDWKDRDQAPPDLVRQWDTFYEALLRHEKGHARITRQQANRVRQQMSRLGARPRCSTLSAEANEVGNQILKKSQRLQDEYDRRTDHGKKEGATLG